MNENFACAVKPIHYFFKIFGMSFVEFKNKWQFSAELIYLFVLFMIFLISTIEHETSIVKYNTEFFGIDVLIVALGCQSRIFIPIFIWIRFLSRNKKIKFLVRTFNDICKLEERDKKLKIVSMFRSACLLMIIFLFAWIFFQSIYIYLALKVTVLRFHLYRFLLRFWCFSAMMQFMCWISFWSIVFQNVIDDLAELWDNPSTVEGSLPLGFDDRNQATVALLKRLLKIKELITEVYGASLIGSLSSTLTCGMYDVYRLLHWFSPRYWSVHVMMLILNAAILIIFFAVIELSTQNVKKSLNMVHNLVVTHQWSLRDKRLRNFSMSFLHEDLTFRVCDLVDLTYKQLLSITSIAVAFLVIQLQLQM